MQQPSAPKPEMTMETGPLRSPLRFLWGPVFVPAFPKRGVLRRPLLLLPQNRLSPLKKAPSAFFFRRRPLGSQSAQALALAIQTGRHRLDFSQPSLKLRLTKIRSAVILGLKTAEVSE
jgi:hypothetical protein